MAHEPNDTDKIAELHDLPLEVLPDASLGDRTVAALRGRGLLRADRAALRMRSAGWLAAASILIVAFLAGYLTGKVGPQPQRPEASFALMLYGTIGGDSATQMARAMEYGQWARAPHESGRVVGGEALGDFVGAAGRPDSLAAGEELVGFFLVQAPDRESATRLAAGCPHVKYGGRVVVREIQPT
jgi:hypothetical protein